MKKILFSFIFLFLIAYLSPVSAQSSCASINSIFVSTTEVESGKLFTCTVTVPNSDAGSRDIGCGISFNGNWPQDFCPSAGFFGGWSGNTATFNCVVPNTNLPKDITSVELKAFDFKPNCGPQTGKSIPLNLKKLTPEQLSTTPIQSPEAQVPLISNILSILFGDGSTNTTNIAPTESTPSSPGSSSFPPFIPQPPNGSPALDASSMYLRSVFEYIGNRVGVPPRVLEGIAHIEYEPSFKIPVSTLQFATQPGNIMPNCPINQCSAAGPMQMTIGRDDQGSASCSRCCWNGRCNNSCPNAWAEHGYAASSFENTPNYTPLPCNMRDNIYASALKLKENTNAASPLAWTRAEVERAGTRYFGDCSVAVREGKTYCQFIWDYYNN